MRTIKFRGKRLDNGEWVYGSLLQGEAQSIIASIEGNSINVHDCFEVSPDTIGQFTGLLDRNGKEIYEDDILKGRTNKWRLEDRPEPHDYIGYVRWDGQCDVGLQWVLSTLDSMGSSPLNWYVHCVAIDYSTGIVIGNIHDNPDLLNGK